jgi:FkbM family methyltransferase
MPLAGGLLAFCLSQVLPVAALLSIRREIAAPAVLVAANATQSSGVAESSSVWKAGVQVHFDPTKHWAKWWRSDYPGWESDAFNVWNHLIKDKVVLDVGAWIGPTALWFGHLAKHVVALEPTSAAFTEFAANLAANPELKGKVDAVNAALDSEDRTATMTNNGDSMDRISLINVKAMTVNSLLKQYPSLQKTEFVKVDTEGYERVIVPALEAFFKEKKPTAFVSLHPMFISHSQVQGVVDKLKSIFPYLYEVDMKTPFNTERSAYTYGDHGGADVVCTWAPLT